MEHKIEITDDDTMKNIPVTHHDMDEFMNKNDTNRWKYLSNWFVVDDENPPIAFRELQLSSAIKSIVRRIPMHMLLKAQKDGIPYAVDNQFKPFVNIFALQGSFEWCENITPKIASVLNGKKKIWDIYFLGMSSLDKYDTPNFVRDRTQEGNLMATLMYQRNDSTLANVEWKRLNKCKHAGLQFRPKREDMEELTRLFEHMTIELPAKPSFMAVRHWVEQKAQEYKILQEGVEGVD